MVINQVELSSLLETIKADIHKARFITRVYFVNQINVYFKLVNALAEIADVTIRLSDEAFCSGKDTVPDFQKVIKFLDEHKDKTILIPNVGEYLRVAEAKERDSSFIFSILNRQVHSCKRVWMPIFNAKALFESIVGRLDEERFGEALYESGEDCTYFEAKVYSNSFVKETNFVDAVGIRQWLSLWDDQTVKSGMSFCTRQIKQITASGGDYVVHIIDSPYKYIFESLSAPNNKLNESFGTTEQWAYLSTFASEANGSLEKMLTYALNVLSFDPLQILSAVKSGQEKKSWVFWLWYKLGLNQASNYISFAVSRAVDYKGIISEIECAILDCTENTRFDEFLTQRKSALACLATTELSIRFWRAFDQLSDNRIKIKILNGATHEERTRILEMASYLLKQGKKPFELRVLLMDKMPDLALYLSKSKLIDGPLGDYIFAYKKEKVANLFSLDFENELAKVNIYDYDTRSLILQKIKLKHDAYYLWIDGMGLEWIDMLIEKVEALEERLSTPQISVGCAVLPTTTSINMEKADKETISKKYGSLDSLSHIKDKADCNYFSIIDKQFGLISEIAELIVNIARENPDRQLVVTADHGMSRIAAKAFHETQGINAPKTSTVCNMGRYCEFDTANIPQEFSNTIKEGNVIAYKTHNHFSTPGYAPGEIHGGATPEEILVPIILFKKIGTQGNKVTSACTYNLLTKSVSLDNNGVAQLAIQTTGQVFAIKVDVDTKQMIQATVAGESLWTVAIPGLRTGETYSVRIFLNNIYSTNTESLTIKRKGFEVDDDFSDF